MKRSMVILILALSFNAVALAAEQDQQYDIILWCGLSSNPVTFSTAVCPGFSEKGVSQQKSCFISGYGAPVNQNGVRPYYGYSWAQVLNFLPKAIEREINITLDKFQPAVSSPSCSDTIVFNSYWDHFDNRADSCSEVGKEKQKLFIANSSKVNKEHGIALPTSVSLADILRANFHDEQAFKRDKKISTVYKQDFSLVVRQGIISGSAYLYQNVLDPQKYGGGAEFFIQYVREIECQPR